MSVLIRFAPPSLTAAQYDKVVARLTEEGVFPAEGLDYEICFGSEGNLKVSQVWDTKEHPRQHPLRARHGVLARDHRWRLLPPFPPSPQASTISATQGRLVAGLRTQRRQLRPTLQPLDATTEPLAARR